MSETPAQAIDLGSIEREVRQQLHAAELHTAELRGQLALIQRLAQLANGPTFTEGETAVTEPPQAPA